MSSKIVASLINSFGAHFDFFIVAGLTAEMLSSCSQFTKHFNGLKIAE